MIQSVKCTCTYFLNLCLQFNNFVFRLKKKKNNWRQIVNTTNTAAIEGNENRVVSPISQGCSVNHSDTDLIKPLNEACK